MGRVSRASLAGIRRDAFRCVDLRRPGTTRPRSPWSCYPAPVRAAPSRPGGVSARSVAAAVFDTSLDKC